MKPLRSKPLSRNTLYLIIAALAIGTVLLSYQLYQDRKKPEGMQINIGEKGITIQKK